MSEVRCNYEELGDMKEGWHLDKKITLALIFAIAVQTVTLFMWGARLDQRVTYVEGASANHTIVIEAMRRESGATSTTLARIDERLAATADGVKEIKAKLDGATTRLTPRKE